MLPRKENRNHGLEVSSNHCLPMCGMEHVSSGASHSYHNLSLGVVVWEEVKIYGACISEILQDNRD